MIELAMMIVATWVVVATGLSIVYFIWSLFTKF